MKKTKIKSAVIGLGVGAHQARTIYAHPECQLISVCDFDKKRLSEIGTEFKNVNLTKNDKDIFYDPDIDLVCIASYDQYHYQQVMKCLENKKHVYVEKPICLKREELKDIKQQFNIYPNLSLSANMVLRTCPLFVKVRENIKSDTMGDIYHIEADYLWGRKEKLYSGWRAEAEFYSIIYGAAIHMVDLVYWITGKKPVSVRGVGSNIMLSGTKQKHDDFTVLLLEYDNQMSVKITAHGGGVHPHFHALKVFGKKTTFIHDYEKSIWLDSEDSNNVFRKENASYPAKNLRGEALVSYVNSLINPEIKSLVSKSDVFDVMSICFAAQEAVKSRDTIRIEYL